MKIKNILPCLLVCALLGLTGCTTPSFIVGPGTIDPDITTSQVSPFDGPSDLSAYISEGEEVSTIWNLTILSDEGGYLQFRQTHVIDFYFQAPLEGLVCLDAQGNRVEPDELTPGLTANLLFTGELPDTEPLDYDGMVNRHTSTLSAEQIVMLRLTDTSASPIVQPLEGLSVEQLAEAAVQSDRGEPPAFLALSPSATEEVVPLLSAIRGVLQPEPEEKTIYDVPAVLRLTYTDGSQVLVGLDEGENFQLTIQADGTTSSYRVRKSYLEQIMELRNDALGYPEWKRRG